MEYNIITKTEDGAKTIKNATEISFNELETLTKKTLGVSEVELMTNKIETVGDTLTLIIQRLNSLENKINTSSKSSVSKCDC